MPRSALPHPNLLPAPAHVERLEWSANSYLVHTPAGCLLVDTGSLLDAARMAALLQGERTIDAVLVTHHHLDHAGNAWMAVRAGLPLICAEAEAPALSRAAPAWRTPGGRTSARGAPPIAARDLTLVRPGQRVLGHEVIALPGHTAGQIGLHLSHHLGVLAADAVLERGGKALAPWERLNEDHAQALRTIGALAERARAGVQVFWPGHGQALSAGAVTRRAARLNEASGAGADPPGGPQG